MPKQQSTEGGRDVQSKNQSRCDAGTTGCVHVCGHPQDSRATPQTKVQEKGSQSPDRKTKHVDETKNHCPSDEFQIDHTQKTLQLPKGASSFIMTHPGSGQPTRIKLPLTKPNQNWCTIRVNIPERRVTCPDSNVSLSVKTLKETTVLAEKGKTVVRIPVANQGEDQNFGVYAIPGLGTHAFVGPFTSKQEEHSGGNDSFVGHDQGI